MSDLKKKNLQKQPQKFSIRERISSLISNKLEYETKRQSHHGKFSLSNPKSLIVEIQNLDENDQGKQYVYGGQFTSAKIFEQNVSKDVRQSKNDSLMQKKIFSRGEINQKESKDKVDKTQRNDHHNFLAEFTHHYKQFYQYHKKKKLETKKIMRHIRDKFLLVEKKKYSSEQQIQSRLKNLKDFDTVAYAEFATRIKDNRISRIFNELYNSLAEVGSGVFKLQAERLFQMSASKKFQEVSQMQLLKQKILNQEHKQQKLSEKLIEIPSTLLAGLQIKHYQEDGIKWLLSSYFRKLNSILADQFGFGKSVQIIAMISYLLFFQNNPGPYLIIVSSDTIDLWEQDFDQLAPTIKKLVMKIVGNDKKINFQETINWNVCLTTWEGALIQRDKLTTIDWNYVIIDKGFKININNNNNFDRLVVVLARQYRTIHKVLLMGSQPQQNKLQDLWALLIYLFPKMVTLCENIQNWLLIACDNKQTQLNESQRLIMTDKFRQVINLLTLRRQNKPILSQSNLYLIINTIRIQPTPLQVRLYNNIKFLKSEKERNQLINKISNHPSLLVNNKNNELILTQQQFITASAKILYLNSLLFKFIKFKHRILLFSECNDTLKLLQTFMNYQNFRYKRLDIDYDESTIRAVQKFTTESQYYIFLLDTNCKNYDLNALIFNSVDTIIMFDSVPSLLNCQSQHYFYRDKLRQIMLIKLMIDFKECDIIGQRIYNADKSINVVIGRGKQQIQYFDEMDQKQITSLSSIKQGQSPLEMELQKYFLLPNQEESQSIVLQIGSIEKQSNNIGRFKYNEIETFQNNQGRIIQNQFQLQNTFKANSIEQQDIRDKKQNEEKVVIIDNSKQILHQNQQKIEHIQQADEQNRSEEKNRKPKKKRKNRELANLAQYMKSISNKQRERLMQLRQSQRKTRSNNIIQKKEQILIDNSSAVDQKQIEKGLKLRGRQQDKKTQQKINKVDKFQKKEEKLQKIESQKSQSKYQQSISQQRISQLQQDNKFKKKSKKAQKRQLDQQKQEENPELIYPRSKAPEKLKDKIQRMKHQKLEKMTPQQKQQKKIQQNNNLNLFLNEYHLNQDIINKQEENEKSQCVHGQNFQEQIFSKFIENRLLKNTQGNVLDQKDIHLTDYQNLQQQKKQNLQQNFNNQNLLDENSNDLPPFLNQNMALEHEDVSHEENLFKGISIKSKQEIIQQRKKIEELLEQKDQLIQRTKKNKKDSDSENDSILDDSSNEIENFQQNKFFDNIKIRPREKNPDPPKPLRIYFRKLAYNNTQSKRITRNMTKYDQGILDIPDTNKSKKFIYEQSFQKDIDKRLERYREQQKNSKTQESENILNSNKKNNRELRALLQNYDKSENIIVKQEYKNHEDNIQESVDEPPKSSVHKHRFKIGESREEVDDQFVIDSINNDIRNKRNHIKLPERKHKPVQKKTNPKEFKEIKKLSALRGNNHIQIKQSKQQSHSNYQRSKLPLIENQQIYNTSEQTDKKMPKVSEYQSLNDKKPGRQSSGSHKKQSSSSRRKRERGPKRSQIELLACNERFYYKNRNKLDNYRKRKRNEENMITKLKNQKKLRKDEQKKTQKQISNFGFHDLSQRAGQSLPVRIQNDSELIKSHNHNLLAEESNIQKKIKKEQQNYLSTFNQLQIYHNKLKALQEQFQIIKENQKAHFLMMTKSKSVEIIEKVADVPISVNNSSKINGESKKEKVIAKSHNQSQQIVKEPNNKQQCQQQDNNNNQQSIVRKIPRRSRRTPRWAPRKRRKKRTIKPITQINKLTNQFNKEVLIKPAPVKQQLDQFNNNKIKNLPILNRKKSFSIQQNDSIIVNDKIIGSTGVRNNNNKTSNQISNILTNRLQITSVINLMIHNKKAVEMKTQKNVVQLKLATNLNEMNVQDKVIEAKDKKDEVIVASKHPSSSHSISKVRELRYLSPAVEISKDIQGKPSTRSNKKIFTNNNKQKQHSIKDKEVDTIGLQSNTINEVKDLKNIKQTKIANNNSSSNIKEFQQDIKQINNKLDMSDFRDNRDILKKQSEPRLRSSNNKTLENKKLDKDKIQEMFKNTKYESKVSNFLEKLIEVQEIDILKPDVPKVVKDHVTEHQDFTFKRVENQFEKEMKERRRQLTMLKQPVTDKPGDARNDTLFSTPSKRPIQSIQEILKIEVKNPTTDNKLLNKPIIKEINSQLINKDVNIVTNNQNETNTLRLDGNLPTQSIDISRQDQDDQWISKRQVDLINKHKIQTTIKTRKKIYSKKVPRPLRTEQQRRKISQQQDTQIRMMGNEQVKNPL